jgi:hypothetical protein
VIPVAANPVGTGQSEGDVQEAVVKEGPATKPEGTTVLVAELTHIV